MDQTPLPVKPCRRTAIARLDDLFGVRDPLTPPPPPLTDTFEGGLYLGTTALEAGGTPAPRVSGRPDEGLELDYGIQANDPMMRDLLQGLYMMAALDTMELPDGAFQPFMDHAIAKLAGGVDGVRDANALLGVRHATLEEVAGRHEIRLGLLNRQISGLEDVDPYEVSTRLNAVEAQLEAAMNATARVARLRLTDYL